STDPSGTSGNSAARSAPTLHYLEHRHALPTSVATAGLHETYSITGKLRPPSVNPQISSIARCNAPRLPALFVRHALDRQAAQAIAKSW
ncbi:MAG TPA: hypothetical protein VE196_10720, partial [Pseudonocardiaceae bacterium]|nr:hypothetical protein [Pseudonocardiaceae bacterium]